MQKREEGKGALRCLFSSSYRILNSNLNHDIIKCHMIISLDTGSVSALRGTAVPSSSCVKSGISPWTLHANHPWLLLQPS